MKSMAPEVSRWSRSIAIRPELQALALKAVEAATIRRWRYMNSIYWFALHGKEDDTPSVEILAGS